MARDEFCEVDCYADEWSPKAPSSFQWHPSPRDESGRLRLDAIARMIEDIWQMPGERCDVVEEDATLAARFREQADKWESETSHLSSPSQRVMHPSYQAILGMGVEHKKKILHLLLNDLQQNRRAWFWALSYLAQDNPIKPSDAGKMDKMIQAWLAWGKAQGLL